MAGVGSDDGFVGEQQSINDHQIGLGAADQKVNGSLRRGAQGANLRGGLRAEVIQPVAAGLESVGVRQGLEDLGWAPSL